AEATACGLGGRAAAPPPGRADALLRPLARRKRAALRASRRTSVRAAPVARASARVLRPPRLAVRRRVLSWAVGYRTEAALSPPRRRAPVLWVKHLRRRRHEPLHRLDRADLPRCAARGGDRPFAHHQRRRVSH